MNTPTSAGFSLSELARRLHRIEPAAILVRPRLLRRIIKQHRGLPGLGLRVPHSQGYVISREDLSALVRPEDLGLDGALPLPEILLLLRRPGLLDFQPQREGRTLLRVSRTLLHLSVHRALQRKPLSPEQVDERMARIGDAAWQEICWVLHQERLIFPHSSPSEVYEEFAGVFLELAHHAPHLLERWFPALDDRDAIRRMLETDIQLPDLLKKTLLPGSPLPSSLDVEIPSEAEVLSRPGTEGQPRERLLVQADAGMLRGNLVRSAILRTRAGADDQARENLRQLTRRLAVALSFDESQRTRWEQALLPLLTPAASGSWSRAARLLYDLQTTCEDREKPFFAVDLVEWLARWGTSPLQRPLPHHGEVRSCRDLRRAMERVPGLPITEDARAELYALLAGALHHAEKEVRTAFRPRIEEVLRTVGFIPRNHAEELARKKVVEELLEIVVERGYLNLGHLRDTIARNRLKLGDLAGPAEFLVGDSLLRANSALATQLDGIYHRAEFYLRWLQSFSSLLFGTVLGRTLTLFLILPFLGSFLVLKFAEEISHLFTKHVHFPEESLYVGAFVILLLLHSAGFRWLVGHFFRRLGQAFYWLLVGFPRAVLRWSPVQWLLRNRAIRFALQVVLKPLAVAAVVTLLGWFLVPIDWRLAFFLTTFFLALIVLNSRYGLYFEEVVGDSAQRTWTLIREDLLLGTLGFLMAVFRRTLEEMERIFYTVDEWLRFRPGDGRGSLVLKAVLGSLWWAITYLFRFAFVVLIEPQINPIKHFPVVTVGHKVLLLAIDPTARALEKSFGIAYLEAAGMVTVVFALIPGVFGFLAWELMENWRLYRANQSPTLDPVRVGSHGETMRGLLRPGFHSGTVPKIFGRLRHLPEKLETPRLHRAHEQLHHVEEAITQFLQRDLLDALHGTRVWRDRVILRIEQVRLDNRRIRVRIHAERLRSSEPLELWFSLGGPWLVFHVEQTGWAGALPRDLAPLWRDALIGFCKHAGVQLLPTQLAAALPRDTRFLISENGLEVQREGAPPAVYDLDDGPRIEPHDAEQNVVLNWPELPATLLRFDASPVRWDDWVKVWQLAQKGNRPAELLPGLPMPGCP